MPTCESNLRMLFGGAQQFLQISLETVADSFARFPYFLPIPANNFSTLLNDRIRCQPLHRPYLFLLCSPNEFPWTAFP